MVSQTGVGAVKASRVISDGDRQNEPAYPGPISTVGQAEGTTVTLDSVLCKVPEAKMIRCGTTESFPLPSSEAGGRIDIFLIN